jgi:hypothetical protein
MPARRVQTLADQPDGQKRSQQPSQAAATGMLAQSSSTSTMPTMPLRSTQPNSEMAREASVSVGSRRGCAGTARRLERTHRRARTPLPLPAVSRCGYLGRTAARRRAERGIATWTIACRNRSASPDATHSKTYSPRERPLALQGARRHHPISMASLPRNRRTYPRPQVRPSASHATGAAGRDSNCRACPTGNAPNAASPHGGRQQVPIHRHHRTHDSPSPLAGVSPAIAANLRTTQAGFS